MTRRRPLRAALRTAEGATGAALVLVLAGVALLGPLMAPHPYDAAVGAAGQGPGDGLLLGADRLGRDVLSRVLHGGTSVIGLGAASTIAAYLPGVLLGLLAAFRRDRVDRLVLRGVDVLLAFPAIVVMLLIAGSLGRSTWAMLLGIVIVQVPAITRLARAAAVDVVTRGYVDVAVSRGDPLPTILRREVLPNVAPVLLVDLGVRFGWSVLLVATMNYLGLGLQPPAADWGLMTAENREFLSANPWAVLAPALLLGLLLVAINLIGDAYSRALSGRDVAIDGARG